MLLASKAALKSGGFTLIEMIVTLVLVGVMAAFAIPRFVGQDAFESRGFFAEMTNGLRYARQQAIAQRRQMCVALSTGGLTITRAQAAGGACDGTALPSPVSGDDYSLAPRAGVTIAGAGTTALPATVVFNPLGQPDVGVSLRISGDIARCLRVESETGYVHQIACP